MSFDIQSLHIPDNSPESEAIEQVMNAEHVGPAEAVILILRATARKKNAALAGLGLFGNSEDAALLDEAVSFAYDERRRPTQRLVDL